MLLAICGLLGLAQAGGTLGKGSPAPWEIHVRGPNLTINRLVFGRLKADGIRNALLDDKQGMVHPYPHTLSLFGQVATIKPASPSAATSNHQSFALSLEAMVPLQVAGSKRSELSKSPYKVVHYISFGHADNYDEGVRLVLKGVDRFCDDWRRHREKFGLSPSGR